jgi:BMFP domain-containing protein YqiC
VLRSQADALRVRLQALESRLAESDEREKKEKPE